MRGPLRRHENAAAGLFLGHVTGEIRDKVTQVDARNALRQVIHRASLIFGIEAGHADSAQSSSAIVLQERHNGTQVDTGFLQHKFETKHRGRLHLVGLIARTEPMIRSTIPAD